MTTLAYLADRTDPRVVVALTRPCTICKTKPSLDCHHPWRGGEPLNRIVHQCRAESHLDKKGSRDE